MPRTYIEYRFDKLLVIGASIAVLFSFVGWIKILELAIHETDYAIIPMALQLIFIVLRKRIIFLISALLLAIPPLVIAIPALWQYTTGLSLIHGLLYLCICGTLINNIALLLLLLRRIQFAWHENQISQ